MARPIFSVRRLPFLTHPGPLGLVAVLLAVVGCARPVSVAAQGCTLDDECPTGQICSAGQCTSGGARACSSDLECDPSNDERCSGGVCVGGGGGGGPGVQCTETKECPTTQYCNAGIGQCSALLDNWCRLDSQCGATAPVCSNRAQGTDFPGRCVACVEDRDCGAGVCQFGTCQAAPGEGEGEGEGDGGGQGTGEGEGEGPPSGAGEGEGEGDVGGWTCNPTYFDAGDGCDCGCGIDDPDCASTGGICDFCYEAGDPARCPGSGDDSCFWALDGVCDEPLDCAYGTDESDCSGGGSSCLTVNDGVCDEDRIFGPCPLGSDAADCALPDGCRDADDGICDEPDYCRAGTDTTDCG